jgi:hypothetical protein
LKTEEEMKNAPWAKAREEAVKGIDEYPKVEVENDPEKTPEDSKKEVLTKLLPSDKPNPKVANVMTIGAGHFWTLEAVFRRVKGV